MVKKFISGLLKKKEKDTSDNSNQEKAVDSVPEELPPLAEDVVQKVEESTPQAAQASPAQPEQPAPAAQPAQSPPPTEQTIENKPDAIADTLPETSEVPEELPSLDVGDLNEPAEEPNIEPSGGLPEEIKKAKAAKINEDDVSAENKIEKSTDSLSSSNLKLEPGSNVSFFSSVLDHINKDEGVKDQLLAGDLFARMSNYWELKKHEVRSGATLSTQGKLEKDMKIQLEQLKVLEQKWQVQKLALDEDLKFLHEREREIQVKVEELRRISNELSLFKEIRPKEYFHLYNGVVLKNLHDLIDVLEIIDNETFNHHVSDSKNDFSDWIMNVIKYKNLAIKIDKAKTREEMIEVLETEPIMMENIKKEFQKKLSPKDYFWLENGVVIKSLFQLLDALKVMDDELFDKHVKEDRNDFSDWINNTLKNKELANKIEKARSKSEMINILELVI